MAKTIELKLKEGDVAPGFTAATSGGGKISLADFKGSHVVLYFYPRDDTPGCTKEACAFRDHFADFKKKGAVVLGVSTDPVKSHDKFVEKFQLPFTLLADEDKKLSKPTVCGDRRVSWAGNIWAHIASPFSSERTGGSKKSGRTSNPPSTPPR